MNSRRKTNPVNKDLRLLLAGVLFFGVVYLKEYTWAWAGTTAFWFIALAVLVFGAVLSLWLTFDLFRWARNGFRPENRWWVFLTALGLVLLAWYGMR